jgi:hypothetical protein
MCRLSNVGGAGLMLSPLGIELGVAELLALP